MTACTDYNLLTYIVRKKKQEKNTNGLTDWVQKKSCKTIFRGTLDVILRMTQVSKYRLNFNKLTRVW